MSQEVRTSPTVVDLSEASPSEPLWNQGIASDQVTESSGNLMVESYADRLMDELFEDVEHLLEGGSIRSFEPSPQSYINLQTLTIASPAYFPRSPGLVAQPTDTPSSLEADLEADKDAATTALVEAASDSPAEVKAAPTSPKPFSRLLLMAAGASLLLALGVWLLHQRGLRWAATPSAPPPTTSQVSSARADSDIRFMDYMARAVETISQKSGTAGTSTTLPMGIGSPLPTVPVPRNPTVPPAPSTSIANARTTTELTRVLDRLTTVLDRLYPTGARAPQAAAPTNPTTLPYPVAANSNNSAAPLHTLVGIAEWGNNSSILIETNGVTERFQLGESLGSSGWNLVSVSKNKAVIRRNGEVRTIFVGQKF